MQGVNARVAHRIVAHSTSWYPNVSKLHSLVSSWLKDTDPLPTYDRDRMSDEDVRSFIRDQIDANVSATKSLLLRELRDSGRACEQARFGRLYKEVAVSEASATAGRTS
jgi:hypothetical protein